MTMSMLLIIPGVAVLVVFLLVMSLGSLLQTGSDKAEKRVRDRLRALAMTDVDDAHVDLVLRDAAMSEIPFLNRVLENLRWASNLEKLICQAEAKGAAGVYLLTCALLAVIGMYAGSFSDRLWVMIVSGIILGYIPIWRLNRMKRKRMEKVPAAVARGPGSHGPCPQGRTYLRRRHAHGG